MQMLFVLQVGVIKRLKAIFNTLPLNTGLHAATTIVPDNKH